MELEYLEWDSDFFGIKIGRIMIADEADFDPDLFKKEAYDKNFDLIYIFKLQTLLSTNTALKANLELTDIQITMSKIFNREEYYNKQHDFRTDLTDIEKAECYKIAEETSIVSRFYKEIYAGAVITKRLYRKWIDNALNKTFSDGLFIEKLSNSVSGIHLIKTDNINKIGYFTLTGVNPNYKRSGIGHNLWMQSFAYWATESEIEKIKSPFSFQNAESFNFHLKMGFNNIEEIKYIYHYRNKIG